MSTDTSVPKIGYLLKTYPKLSETFILNEIVQLERLGVPLHLFSLKKPVRFEKFHPAVAEVQANVTYVPSIGIRSDPLDAMYVIFEHVELFLRSPRRYLSTLKFYLRESRKPRLKEFVQAGFLTRALQRRKIRHLHAHFANVPTSVAELVQRFSGISISFTAHAKDIYLNSEQELARKMRAARFVLTCTGYNRKHLEAIGAGGTPIHLAYHGVDLGRFRVLEIRERAGGPPRLLSVGRFCEKKGFPYLIEACRLLKDRGLEFSCAIVGFGPLREKLEQLIADLDLSSHVTLLPEMTQDLLIDMYLDADAFVLPCILTDDGDRDGIPNVLIEAMAMRVPVVSTEVSGIPELVDHMHNGLLVPQKNAAALADALELLLARPELRCRFGEDGRAKVMRQFELENNVREIRDLLLAPQSGKGEPCETAAGAAR